MAKGYTKIKNELFDGLAMLDISSQDFRVLLFIIRSTICFHKKYRELSVSYISKGTGINERQVKRVLKRLSDKKIIAIRQKAIGCHPQIIEILGDISGQAWGHFRSALGDTEDTHKGDTEDTQEIKEEIKEEEIKEKEKASPTLSISEEKEVTLAELAAWSQEQEDDDGDL